MIRTAVDSSVLLDVLAADPVYGKSSLSLLQKCWREGYLIACDVVWAEIRPRFTTDEELLVVTEKMGLGFEPLTRESALMAGTIWKKYRAGGGKRTRTIPDFLIGAHAFVQANRFLTRDRGFYRKYFQQLKIVSAA